jgi:S-adenosylmethionine:tRNA ribosyltransferase-isomerase
MDGSSGLNMEHYFYELPQERIAEYPVPQRDLSRLLVMRGDRPEEDIFRNLPAYLPDGGMMVFNDTRVIRARLVFRKATGARIEVFCLEPMEPSAEISLAFGAASPVVWKCLIGNAKKWRSGKLLSMLDSPSGAFSFIAERTGEIDGAFMVRFSWDPAGLSFARVLEEAGKVPLPPYIQREAEEADISRYQTVYARYDGSVAAPTAGLHFTDDVMEAIRKKNILTGNVTLHVSAGTFKPVSHADIHDHEMHTEQLVIRRRLVEDLLANKGSVTAVGTTSMRTLESLYWYGHMLAHDPEAGFHVTQWYPYQERNAQWSAGQSLQRVLKYMHDRGLEEIHGTTSLIIIPSYRFRIVDILVTNFHMPRSTLLLLVAAFAGEKWREAYQYALGHGFRFLSYGDSCLFYRNDQTL